jgi:hypothetical protein
LVRQAIELERLTSDWLEPQLSPQHVKMLKQSGQDRGLTLELVLRDSLRELHRERGAEDPAVALDLGEEAPAEAGDESADTKEEGEAKELKGFLDRRAKRGGDLGHVGLGQ